MLKSKRARRIFVALLTVFPLAGVTQPSFAENNKTLDDKIMEYAEYDSEEYYAFAKMWSDYFLSFLPTDKEPEALKMLTHMPDRDADYEVWNNFFTDGDPAIMRDEVFRIADELDLTNSNLSQSEKAERITYYISEGPAKESIINSDNKVINGYKYDCTTRAEGALSIHRLVGIPAISVGMISRGEGHEEAFIYIDGLWRSAGNPNESLRNLSRSFTDFFRFPISLIVTDYTKTYIDTTTGRDYGSLIDINESYVDSNVHNFMFYLLKKPFAYPNEKLTRGMVAKLVCNYIGIVPMRNEQIFSDVPIDHIYSPYIWAINKLGVMNGIDNNNFNPDAELTMQEFAAVASNIIEWRKSDIPYRIEAAGKLDPNIYDIEAGRKHLEKELSALTPPADSTPAVFKDADQIAPWAKPIVDDFSRFADNLNRAILQGDGNGYLNPTETLSKVRFLVFMYKFNNVFNIHNYSGNGTALF